MVRLGQIVLFSKDKQRLASFLCDLFEMEMDINADSISLGDGEISFLIIERPRLAECGSSTLVDFYVDSEDDLNELNSKIEFLTYRLQSSGESEELIQSMKKPEIKDLGEVKFFFMTDPDGRRWKISNLCL